MKPIILIHGGAGPDSDFIRKNIEGYKNGLRSALESGYKILEEDGSALDAVEAAVRDMEDNPLFNCGCGSALTEDALIEMCSSIMDGKTLQNGAASLVSGVRHPVTLAKAILHKKNTGYLGAHGAKKFAEEAGLELMPETCFITAHQREEYENSLKEKKGAWGHGTVGAVAIDGSGNIAAATSTGGLNFCRSGRIADSGMIGVGCYANNNTCAVSCTGDGEVIMREVLAHAIASEIKYTGRSIKACVDQVIHEDNKSTGGDLGAIVINSSGEFAFSFNTARMHRGIKKDGLTEVSVY